jgi:hypothetical protein
LEGAADGGAQIVREWKHETGCRFHEWKHELPVVRLLYCKFLPRWAKEGKILS